MYIYIYIYTHAIVCVLSPPRRARCRLAPAAGTRRRPGSPETCFLLFSIVLLVYVFLFYSLFVYFFVLLSKQNTYFISDVYLLFSFLSVSDSVIVSIIRLLLLYLYYIIIYTTTTTTTTYHYLQCTFFS